MMMIHKLSLVVIVGLMLDSCLASYDISPTVESNDKLRYHFTDIYGRMKFFYSIHYDKIDRNLDKFLDLVRKDQKLPYRTPDPLLLEGVDYLSKLKSAKKCSSDLIPLMAEIRQLSWVSDKQFLKEIMVPLIDTFDAKECDSVIFDSLKKAQDDPRNGRIQKFLKQIEPPQILDDQDQNMFNQYLAKALYYREWNLDYTPNVYKEFLKASYGDEKRSDYKYIKGGREYEDFKLFSRLYDKYIVEPCIKFHSIWGPSIQTLVAIKAINRDEPQVRILDTIKDFPETYKAAFYRYIFCESCFTYGSALESLFKKAKHVIKA